VSVLVTSAIETFRQPPFANHRQSQPVLTSLLNNAAVKVVVEISAEFPDGAREQVKRAVSENSRSLGLKSADWE
jgi:hypothetical protein